MSFQTHSTCISNPHVLLTLNQSSPAYNAPINVMPHLPLPQVQAEVGICIPENYNFPPTGEVLAIQTLTYSKTPSSKTRG